MEEILSIIDNYNKVPEYSKGRFFISPVLGCASRCAYCYIYSHGYTAKCNKNQLSIDNLINEIEAHPAYRSGPTGTILSIGAWGDPFQNEIAAEITVSLIENLASLGNPIQVSSKYTVKDHRKRRIARAVKYPNQLLFLTTIVTFSQWGNIEPYADSPQERLASLSKFKEFDVPTSVFIKPFLFGITDADTELFTRKFQEFSISTCVVGVFYWNDNIIRTLMRQKLMTDELLNIVKSCGCNHGLVCDPKSEYKTYHGKLLDGFCDALRQEGISVFKNTNCVSAWLLSVPRVGSLCREDPHGICVKCGMHPQKGD